MFFLLKSVSFALIARQIRAGYKSDGGANRLHKRSDFISFLGFMTYLAVPFLYELRVLLDYACTDSALDLFDWLKLENINRELFRVYVRNDTIATTRWGRSRRRLSSCRAAGRSCCCSPSYWCPSTCSPRVTAGWRQSCTPRTQITVSARDGTATCPVFYGGYQKHIGVPYAWADLNTNTSAPPITYPGQEQEVCLAPDSDRVWAPPPPRLAAFNGVVSTPGTVVEAAWTFERKLPLDNQVLYARGPPVKLDRTLAQQFYQVANGDRDVVLIRGLYPRAWRLLGNGEPIANYSTDAMVDCELRLNGFGTPQPWWGARCGQVLAQIDANNYDMFVPCDSHGQGPELILVSAQVARGALASFSKFVGGLTGVYVVYVLAVGSFARQFTTNLTQHIPYMELPSTHRLVRLCEDIYAMRAAKEFALEAAVLAVGRTAGRGALRVYQDTRGRDAGAAEADRGPRDGGEGTARAAAARGLDAASCGRPHRVGHLSVEGDAKKTALWESFVSSENDHVVLRSRGAAARHETRRGLGVLGRLYPHPLGVLGSALLEKPVSSLLRRVCVVGIIEQLLDTHQDLLDGDGGLPAFVLVEDAEAHLATGVDVRVKNPAGSETLGSLDG